jgi:hypothetical protein
VAISLAVSVPVHFLLSDCSRMSLIVETLISRMAETSSRKRSSQSRI